jgi:hypothetical protein
VWELRKQKHLGKLVRGFRGVVIGRVVAESQDTVEVQTAADNVVLLPVATIYSADASEVRLILYAKNVRDFSLRPDQERAS